MPTVLVTGSCGLIGSEVSLFFARQGFQVHGIDDNHRAVFFGPDGDTSWVLDHLRREIPGYQHSALDIREREDVLALLDELRKLVDVQVFASRPPAFNPADFDVTLYQVGIVLGILAAVFINMQIQRMGDDAWNTAVGWRWMFLMGLFPAIAFAAIIVPAPESPRWLMKMGRIPEAVTVLTQINGAVTANREAAEIQSSLEVEEGHLSELLTSFRRPLLLGIMLACFSQTSGITATLSFLPEVFQAAGTATADAFMQSVLVGVVNLIFTLIGLWLIDVTGRKTLIVAGSFVQFLSFALVGLLFYLRGSGALVVVFVMTFVIGHAFGNGVACWVIISEIYPAKIRGRAMSIATTTLWMCSYLANQLFPIMMKHLGPDGTFWSFSSAALVAMICFWKLVPETKGRSLEQITRFWVEKRAS